MDFDAIELTSRLKGVQLQTSMMLVGIRALQNQIDRRKRDSD